MLGNAYALAKQTHQDCDAIVRDATAVKLGEKKPSLEVALRAKGVSTRLKWMPILAGAANIAVTTRRHESLPNLLIRRMARQLAKLFH